MVDYEERILDALEKEKTVAFIQFLNELLILSAMIVLEIMSRSLLLLAGAVGAVSLLIQAWIVYSISKKLTKNKSYEYDYGMGKFESFGGLIANLFMLIGLIAVLCTSIIGFFNPVKPSDILLWAIIVTAICTLINVGLFLKQRKINKIAHSKLIEAEDHVLRKNILFGSISLVAIAVVYIFRGVPLVVYFEPALCLVFSVVMIIKLVHPIKQCAYDLLDKTLDEDIQLKIMKALAAGNDQYETFRTVRTRSSGQTVYIDLLIGFKNDKTYEEINTALKQLETLITAEIPNCVVSIVLTNR